MNETVSMLPFEIADDVLTALIDAATHPPTPGYEAALVWSPRLVDLDDVRRKDLELGSGFVVQFYPPGARLPSSFHDIAPTCRISISDRTLEQLRGKRLHYVARNITLPNGRTEEVRVLTASDIIK